MDAVAFGVISDARAIQRRRRLLLATGGLVVLGGIALVFALVHQTPARQVSLRIVAGYGRGTPSKEQALRVVRSVPGFRRVRDTSRSATVTLTMTPVTFRAGRRPTVTLSRNGYVVPTGFVPRLVVLPTWSELDAVYKTRKSPAQLAQELQSKLRGGTTVSPGD